MWALDPGGGIIEFSHLIVVLNDAVGVYSGESEPTVRLICCDVWNNQHGNYGGYCSDPGSADGNLSVDPQFCGPQVGD